MRNQEIAEIFFEIADLLELKNVQWKPRAYRTAAMSIQSLPGDIEDYYKEKKLKEIPGVGENIEQKIIEIIETGKLKYLSDLRKQFPIDIEAINKIPGMGPKKAMALYKKLGVKTIDDLKKAAHEGKIAKLKGFGEKTQEEILKGISIAKQSKRILLAFALPTALQITEYLKKCSGVIEVEPAGSLRRRCETIGDLDILVSSKQPEKVMDCFVSMPNVKKIIAKGDTKSSVLVENNLQVDVRVVKPEEWGSGLQYFTGSKAHSIELRKIAQKKGLKLSEYGVFKGKKIIASKTEKEVYKALGLDYIEPELREVQGEITAAQKHSLPDLVKYSEVKGDFHLHSKFSDGKNSIEEIAEASLEKGYSFCAITDHFGNLEIAHSLNEKRLSKYVEEIEKVQKKFSNLKFFKGCEADILPNGEISISKDSAKKLDFVCASIHSSFRLSEKDQTKRMLKAIENPFVKIIGHPTGRKIFEREPIDLDFEEIFSTAKKNSVALEINAMPDRMDLNDVNSKEAIEAGAVLSIGSDSHVVEQMHFLDLGTAIARRAWGEKKSILNSWSLAKIENFFEK